MPEMGTHQAALGNQWGLQPPTWLEKEQYRTGTEQWGMEFNETVRQFDVSLAAQIKQYEAQEAAAIQRAQIAASATTGAASIYAQADIEAANISAAAARYNADTLMKIAQLDNETKYKIAQESNKLEAMKYETERFQHPGKWAEQEAWFAAGGAPAIETPTRSVVPQMPGMTPVGSAAGSQAAGWTPSAPQAIVGEGGPELATATPSGIDISPLQKQQAWFLKNQGVQGMQGGGTIEEPWSMRNPFAMSQAPRGAAVLPPGGGGVTVRGAPYAGIGGRIPIRGSTAPNPPEGWVNPLPGRGGGRGGGGAGGAGGAGGGTQPIVGPGGEAPAQGEITPSVLSYLRGETPYPGWGGQQIGQFQIPGGPNYGDVPLPGQINLVDFLNLPYDLQQMYLSATEATYSMTPGQTSQWMAAFAPRGIASPVATWG